MATKKKTKKRPGKGTGKPVGRRSLIHDQVLVALILQSVEKGNVLKDAAMSQGLSEASLHEWRARGTDALEAARKKLGADVSYEDVLAAVSERERPYAEFSEQIARAVSKAKVKVHDVIAGIAAKAESDDHRVMRVGLDAAKFMLERRWPEDYGRADRLELTGNDKAPIGIRIFLPKLEDK